MPSHRLATTTQHGRLRLGNAACWVGHGAWASDGPPLDASGWQATRRPQGHREMPLRAFTAQRRATLECDLCQHARTIRRRC
jgi:hypothetical protein